MQDKYDNYEYDYAEIEIGWVHYTVVDPMIQKPIG
jgi:hypothetical protein